MTKQFPYLQDTKHDFYWIHHSLTECYGCPDKWVDLKHADWMRKAWHHELNWESDWGKLDRLAYEALVAKMLIEDRVLPLSK